jgi:hypothetical protein
VGTHTQIIKAMALIQRPSDGALLVSEHTDPALAPSAGRPRGIRRICAGYRASEFLEEIGQRLTDVRLLGVLENIFQWDGATQHEIVFMFAGALADPAAYEITEQYISNEVDTPTRVIWRPPGAASPPVYPVGAELLLATRHA